MDLSSIQGQAFGPIFLVTTIHNSMAVMLPIPSYLLTHSHTPISLSPIQTEELRNTGKDPWADKMVSQDLQASSWVD